MIYCDGFIFGCGGSYEDKKASWERARAAKVEAQRLAEIKAQEEKEQEVNTKIINEENIEIIKDQNIEIVNNNLSEEEIIDNIQIIEEVVNDDYCDGM